MGSIYEAITELVGISSKQSDVHSQFIMVADLGNKDRLYAIDEDFNAYKLGSLQGIKDNRNWQKQLDSGAAPKITKIGSQTIYHKVPKDELEDDSAITYPSLVRTNSGHLVLLAA